MGNPVDRDFWNERWQTNQIAFHQTQPNRLLVEHFEALSPQRGSRVFVPLCGKTLDIHWLLDGGYRVAGVELIEKAVEELFAELGTEPVREQLGSLARYSAENIDVLVGDIFDVTADLLGPVDAVYDRAALVALPAPARARYAEHLARITGAAPQLLICFEYDQKLMDGPPFSIDPEMVRDYYARYYELELLERREISETLKGHPADASVWLLRRRTR